MNLKIKKSNLRGINIYNKLPYDVKDVVDKYLIENNKKKYHKIIYEEMGLGVLPKWLIIKRLECEILTTLKPSKILSIFNDKGFIITDTDALSNILILLNECMFMYMGWGWDNGCYCDNGGENYNDIYNGLSDLITLFQICDTTTIGELDEGVVNGYMVITLWEDAWEQIRLGLDHWTFKNICCKKSFIYHSKTIGINEVESIEATVNDMGYELLLNDDTFEINYTAVFQYAMESLFSTILMAVIYKKNIDVWNEL